MREIKFSLEDGVNRVVARVIDQKTKEVIREIPADEMRNMMDDFANTDDGLSEDKGYEITGMDAARIVERCG